MGTVVDVVTIGLQLGGVYALVALGIVLVYKATKVLNFAHGGIGSASAFLAYVLIVQLHDGAAGEVSLRLLLLATGAAVVAVAGLAVAVNLLLRRLAAATPVTSLVATIGVLLAKPGNDASVVYWDFSWQAPPYLACAFWVVLVCLAGWRWSDGRA